MFGNESKHEAGMTLVAPNCELVGDVHFSDQLMVDGVIKGNVYAQAGSKAVITISEKGRVEGEIRVPNVIVNGKVLGDIRSDKHIELAGKAAVKGNIYYCLIEMVKGATVDGQLVHTQEGKSSVDEAKSPRAADKTEEEAQVSQVAAIKSQGNQT